MSRLPTQLVRLLVIGASASLLVACTPGSGSLGPVATPAPTPGASVPVGTPEPTGGPTPTATATGSLVPGSAAPSPSAAGTTTVRAYFFLGSFTHPAGLVPVLRVVPKTQAVATAAITALLAGPNATELAARPAMYTTVPDGTKLLGLSIQGGVATIDLSKEFESGGGTASVLGRLGQVVYTLTQFSTVTSVTFQIDGQPVTTFSGAGVVLDHPVGRADYRDQLPPIWVDRPAWGAAAGNPARVTGLANVFESAFRVAILDADGLTLVDQPVQATCGTGCWGTFDVTLGYAVDTARWGTLRVYDLSAKDGSVQDVTEYPVWLTPTG